MTTSAGTDRRGTWCVLRVRRSHLVLMRPNPVQLGHLGLELMLGVRLALRFRAPLWIIRPEQVVDTAPYELVADGVKIRVIKGRLGRFLTWLFFGGNVMEGLRKSEPLIYGSPLRHLLVYRFGFGEVPSQQLRQPKVDPKRPAKTDFRNGAAPTVLQRWIGISEGSAKEKKKAAKTKVAAMDASVKHTVRSAPAVPANKVVNKVKKGRPTPSSLDVPDRVWVNSTYFKRLWLDQAPPLRIPERRLPALQAQAEKLGIGPGTRLVGLHMREPGFKMGREIHDAKPGARMNDSMRNVAIANYQLAIDHLCANGYTIVRIGDPTMTPIRRPGVLDLATSSERTDLLEFYCVSRSDFFIGCESGASLLARLCHRPVVTLNATEPLSGSYPVQGLEIFTLKHARERGGGRLLSPLEMLSPAYLDHARSVERFEYSDNSPEDILSAVEDMIDIIDHGLKPETPEQREFRLKAISVGVRKRLSNSVVRKWGPHHGFIGRGRIAPSFARRYIKLQVKTEVVTDDASERATVEAGALPR